MTAKMWIEAFGYLGSALVVVSMLMTSVVRLRIINLTGSVIFAIYALIIQSYPTALMNFFLVGINIYHLAKLKGTKKTYDLIETAGKDGYLRFLVDSYREDILGIFPGTRLDDTSYDLSYLVCCEGNPAGLFFGNRGKDGEIDVALDYATPIYRDASVGGFLYGKLAEKGFKSLVWRGNTEKHSDYLAKTGFVKREDGAYVKSLAG